MTDKNKKNFEIVSIATETEPRIKDNETGKNYSLIEAVCLIWEEIREIKKAIA